MTKHKIYQDCIQVVEQGENFRSKLKFAIEKNYDSISNFAKLAEMDKADLSRFLSGKKDWQFQKVLYVLFMLESDINIYMGGKRGFSSVISHETRFR